MYSCRCGICAGRSLRCSVKFTVNSVSCPGVRLSAGHEEEVYICVYLFEQRVCTRQVPALFPFLFYETFQTSKIYTGCHNLRDVSTALKDECIQIALLQVGYSGIPKYLATYESNLHDFLFPLLNFVSSYSGAEREILLSPSKHFPGIIGPRLEFSTRAAIHEGVECCPYLLNSHWELSREGIRRPTARLYVNPENRLVGPNFVHDQGAVQMEDRPLFVVDSKLFCRTPSLYREHEGKRAYCCRSPHRYSNCAACRFDSKSPSPTRHHHKYASGLSGGSVKKHKRAHSPRKDHYPTRQQHRNVANRSHADVARQIENPENIMLQPPSPEIFRQDQERLSPSMSPVLSPVVERRDPSSPRPMLVRSPVFNKPTFRERFNNLPFDVAAHRYNRAEAPHLAAFRAITQRDQAQQTDYDYYYYGKPPLSPALTNWKDCCCSHDLHHAYQCSCPYCPCYWRYRLASPLGLHYWKPFHHDLGIYDSLYH